MISQYSILLSEATKRGLDPIWLSNPLIEMKDTLWSNCDKAYASANRIYGENAQK